MKPPFIDQSMYLNDSFSTMLDVIKAMMKAYPLSVLSKKSAIYNKVTSTLITLMLAPESQAPQQATCMTQN